LSFQTPFAVRVGFEILIFFFVVFTSDFLAVSC